jgi:hypothetical protein
MAFDESITGGTTSKIIEVMVRDSTTGLGKTGLAFGDVTASYCREGATRTAISLATGAAGDSYSTGKWCEVDSTNQRGLYQLHIPDNAIAAGVAAVTIGLQATGMIDKEIRLKLETPVNVTQINSSSSSAVRLALSAAQIIPGTVDTTVASTTTSFESDDITEATNDHFNGRIVVFTSGDLIGQATAITDYTNNGGNGVFTVVGLTEAPANDVTFIVV